MTELSQIRTIAIEAALKLENHGNITNLLANAKSILDFLEGKSE